ncbi:MAG: Sec-independent protein translocase protein TatB [Acidimicrobiia bacterium]|nr:Sec-independent protein translocase protein TatB [Acidimicrobiia bacterium]
MFNVGGGEIVVILLVALIVLGPTKLPGAARQVGKVLSDFRRMSNDFKEELKSAVPDEVNDLKRELDETQRVLRRSNIDAEIEAKARAKGRELIDADADAAATTAPAPPEGGVGASPDEGTGSPPTSTAAAAGMFGDDETDEADEAPEPADQPATEPAPIAEDS